MLEKSSGGKLMHMTRMIDDLLDVSRITQDKIELRKNRIELVSVQTVPLSRAVGTCKTVGKLDPHGE